MSVPVGNAQTTSASERSVAEIKSSAWLHGGTTKGEVCVDSGSNRSVIDGYIETHSHRGHTFSPTPQAAMPSNTTFQVEISKFEWHLEISSLQQPV